MGMKENKYHKKTQTCPFKYFTKTQTLVPKKLHQTNIGYQSLKNVNKTHDYLFRTGNKSHTP